jgi:hypothetical protein
MAKLKHRNTKLAKGDRVTVKVPYANHPTVLYDGVIVGEGRDGHSWQVIKDGTKFPRGIHKSFCTPVGAIWCRECDVNLVEKEDELCPGCDAYRDHTGAF